MGCRERINKPQLHLSILQAVNTPVAARNLPREARVTYDFSPVLTELKEGSQRSSLLILGFSW